MSHHTQQGFSAVELLITLFIGAFFLFAGYTIWSQVTVQGVESSKMAAASNIAYSNLRKHINTSYPACNYTTPVQVATEAVSTPTVSGTATITRSCPDTSRTNTTLITSKVTYQSEEVSHAMLVFN